MTTPYVDPQTIHNPATGTSPPASWGDAVRDGLEFLAKPPGCQSVRSSNQAVATSSWTSVLFESDERDTDAYHDTNTNPQNFVVPAGLGGFYAVKFVTQWAANGSGFRGVRLQVNGNTVIPGSIYVPPIAGQEVRLQLADEVLLAAGDVLTCDVWQSSGGSLDLTGAKVTMRLVAVS